MRNVNCPKTLVYIRCDAFGGSDEQFEAAWLVSVRAMRNRPLCFQAWVIKETAEAVFENCAPAQLQILLGTVRGHTGTNARGRNHGPEGR